MYKLVVVEDERDVRSRIISLIKKAGSGFEIAAEYETGIDAYDGIISDNPDLIVTDIKIPYIDGIELAKRIREVLPLVRIIILTGYNEFDYAKEAANLGVVGFVSKPVTQGDIGALLKKAEASLDDEYLTASNLNRLEAFYKSSQPIIRENDLYRLSNMPDVPPAFENKLRHSGVRLDYRYFAMCVFDFDETPEGDLERYDLAFSSVRQYVGDAFDGFCDRELFGRYEKLCLLLKFDGAPDIKEVERRLERIVQRVGRYSDMPLSAGVSSVYESRNFAAMVKEAMRALEYRSAIGGRKVFYFGNINPPASKLAVDDDMIKELGYILRFKSAGECLDGIDRLRNSIRDSAESLYYVATSVLNVLIRACDNLEGLYERYGGPGGLYRRLFEIKTDGEICDYLKELAGMIGELNGDVIVDNVERSLQKILSYMEAHFCDPDISFESLAREVNFSVSYISALLKKKRNTSFVKLLTGMRIEKAKELLADPALKIIDIAERLGYNDSYYFSHCFKKYTGMSPKEYRSHEQKD